MTTTPAPALLRRLGVVLRPDPLRVVSLDFVPGEDAHHTPGSRTDALIGRILALSDDEVSAALAGTLSTFAGRHRDLVGLLDERFERVSHRIAGLGSLAQDRRRLIGACLSQEYAIEGAALFNPSMVRHPDQTGLPDGSVRFVMSVRGVGEGHISSIGLRTGTVDADDEVRFDEPGALATRPRRLPAADGSGDDDYTVAFDPQVPFGERVLLPSTAAESNGMEDLRLVQATGRGGDGGYLGTYIAFDGTHIVTQLVETEDFITLRMSRLTGGAVANKGLALFPRPVHGEHLALARWDRESNGIATSKDLRHWEGSGTLRTPRYAWEIVQSGNCGSPIETAAGWLVLTHGVGPMRQYGIGAMLLDLDDPRRVIGVLERPLLEAEGDERDGYVPHVVYSCGAMAHGGTLVLPYGTSDSAVRVALVDLAGLLARLEASRTKAGGAPLVARPSSLVRNSGN